MSPEYTIELIIYLGAIGINGMMFAVVCEAIDKKCNKILDKILEGIKNE